MNIKRITYFIGILFLKHSINLIVLIHLILEWKGLKLHLRLIKFVTHLENELYFIDPNREK